MAMLYVRCYVKSLITIVKSRARLFTLGWLESFSDEGGM